MNEVCINLLISPIKSGRKKVQLSEVYNFSVTKAGTGRTVAFLLSFQRSKSGPSGFDQLGLMFLVIQISQQILVASVPW